MKTAFLFKSQPIVADVTIEDKQGLYFTTVTSDLRFLDNLVITNPDCDIRFYVQQEVNGDIVGSPAVWILGMTDKVNMNNQGFELAWNYISQICCTFYPYIKMGIPLSPHQAWTYPNIPNHWGIEETLLAYNEKGKVSGIYWDDPKAKEYLEDGEVKKKLTEQTIKADLITLIVSKNMLHQMHYTHIVVPNNNMNVNKREFYLGVDILKSIEDKGFDYLDTATKAYLQRLFSMAISTKDFFAGYLIFYKMVEVIENMIEPTKLDKELKNKLKKFVSEDPELAVHKERIMGMIGNIKEETSFELIEKGLDSLLGNNWRDEVCITNDIHKSWRHIRGDLSHAEKQVLLTNGKFIKNYSSIRVFCTDVIHTMLKTKGFELKTSKDLELEALAEKSKE